MISKYEQSGWFSKFLVMLSQQAKDFGGSVPDALGTRLMKSLKIYKEYLKFPYTIHATQCLLSPLFKAALPEYIYLLID